MEIFDAIKLLDKEYNILIDNNKDIFQKYNDDQIFITFDKKRMKRENNSSIGKSMTNKEFLEKYKNHSFELLKQWYQKDYKIPILCWVTTSQWQYSKKLVLFSYVSGYWFNTGFQESYTPSHSTIITPLTNKEIKALQQPKKKD